MLELGDQSREAHRAIGRLLASSRADRVFLYGAETRNALEVLNSADVFFTDTMDVLARELEGYIRPGDLVLLKGSRGCALEKLSEVLTEAA
jgi:UDP-N-acetylmuramoyl-tripeptide--D-alanyl-D-alanine ligase